MKLTNILAGSTAAAADLAQDGTLWSHLESVLLGIAVWGIGQLLDFLKGKASRK